MDGSVLAIMLGSCVSGALARVPCHGLDTLKARVQARGGGGLRSTLRELLHAQGWRGLYRGFGIALVGGVPASCLYFTTYELAKARLLGAPVPAPLAHLAAGMAAEAVSCVLYVPIDVVKERMQVQRPGGALYYRSSRDALAQILGGAEGLRGLYKGYWATLASYGPFSALYFALYEWLREGALAPQQQAAAAAAAQLPLWQQVAVAGGAGAGASLATNPLDLVKLRLQVQRAAAMGSGGGAAPGAYRGLWHGLQCLVAEEGLRGLLRGAGVRVAFHTASTAIAMSMFEYCKAGAARLLEGAGVAAAGPGARGGAEG